MFKKVAIARMLAVVMISATLLGSVFVQAKDAEQDLCTSIMILSKVGRGIRVGATGMATVILGGSAVATGSLGLQAIYSGNMRKGKEQLLFAVGCSIMTLCAATLCRKAYSEDGFYEDLEKLEQYKCIKENATSAGYEISSNKK